MHVTASRLGKLGYSCMEEIEAKDLKAACAKLEALAGPALAVALIEFASNCCTNPEQSLQRVVERLSKGRLDNIEKLVPQTLTAFLAEAAASLGFDQAVELLDLLKELEGRRMYRKELFYALRRSLQLKLANPEMNLSQAVHEVRQRVSHGGRREERRIISRPILVKGLQFDHVVVVDPARFTCEELYVALSRATKSVTVVGFELDKVAPGTKEKASRPKKATAPDGTPSMFEKF
jgi:hypothetical protein